MVFKLGESGNPKGKPKGTKDKRTALRALLDPHSKDLIEKAVALALDGDTTALKLCLDRCIPPYKPQTAPVQFTPAGDTLTDQAYAIIAAMGSGEIPPDVAVAMLAALGGLAQMIKTDELKRRIEALEEQTYENTGS